MTVGMHVQCSDLEVIGSSTVQNKSISCYAHGMDTQILPDDSSNDGPIQYVTR